MVIIVINYFLNKLLSCATPSDSSSLRSISIIVSDRFRSSGMFICRDKTRILWGCVDGPRGTEPPPAPILGVSLMHEADWNNQEYFSKRSLSTGRAVSSSSSERYATNVMDVEGFHIFCIDSRKTKYVVLGSC